MSDEIDEIKFGQLVDELKLNAFKFLMSEVEKIPFSSRIKISLVCASSAHLTQYLSDYLDNNGLPNIIQNYQLHVAAEKLRNLFPSEPTTTTLKPPNGLN